MTDAPAVEQAHHGAPKLDERLVYRGPMRRWLMSPEIGALIGAVVVWTFFWGAGKTFGEADTTLNWLDVAAPIGIMATAVALLMIGGEFDLSSGVMTGASAILVGLMTTYFKGDGINIGWAIAAAFLAAAAIGWFNGYLVNRTGLPSFIVTLASFFVLRGVMLVMSKRLAKKVQVANIDDQKGAKDFKNILAHEWKFTEFGARDKLFLAFLIIGGALFAYGLFEQSFTRRRSTSPTNAIVGLAGVIAAAVGFAGLLKTDGVSKNGLFGLIGAVGVVLAVVGVAKARFQPRAAHPITRAIPAAASLRFGLGVAGVAMACLAPIAFDRREGRPMLTWTASGLRPIIAVLAAATGVALAVRALAPAMRSHKRHSAAVQILLFGLYSGLLVLVGVLSFLQLTTVQGFRAIVMVSLAAIGVVLLLNARGIAGKSSPSAQLIIGLVAAAAVVVLAFVVRADSGAVRFRTGLFSALVIGATLIVANTLLEFMMEKRTRPDHSADRLGKRLLVSGAVMAVAGLVLRLVWTNYTAAHAKAAKASGQAVGQNVLRQSVVWWVLVAAVGAYVLTKTKWGNWIFAVGGNKDASRAVGVPTDRVKVGLFVVVSLCGCLAGVLIALRYGTVQANQGTGQELEYIIAAVVGGCLMTGGYGSVIGASLGAAIMAMTQQGVQTTGWDANGYYAFLGAILLLAVLVNNYTRKKAQEAR